MSAPAGLTPAPMFWSRPWSDSSRSTNHQPRRKMIRHNIRIIEMAKKTHNTKLGPYSSNDHGEKGSTYPVDESGTPKRPQRQIWRTIEDNGNNGGLADKLPRKG